jgi:hypothetical protein
VGTCVLTLELIKKTRVLYRDILSTLKHFVLQKSLHGPMVSRHRVGRKRTHLLMTQNGQGTLTQDTEGTEEADGECQDHGQQEAAD